MMPDQNPGVSDPTLPGAQGASGQPDTKAEPEPEKSLNSQAKDLPWVKELMQRSAELDRIKAEQDKAAAEAERKRAESQGEYDKALALEQEKYKQLETKHLEEVKQLRLDAAFAHAGLIDPRIVSLFVAGYDPAIPADAYVETVKSDPKNAAFFGKQRQGIKPPPLAGETPPDEFDPERDLRGWLASKDPKKRERAIQHNREMYARQLHLKG